MKKINIKPLADYVLIEPVEEETTLPSGIILPDTAKEKPQKGKIIATGPGKKDEHGKTIAMEIRVGQFVMYKKWGGTEVKADGKEYLLVKEEDLLATVED
ncbi:MAG: 10 kDa chaperonin [candidate division WWE3 bacterium GW2011_GWA1_46_21]|uniref:Co-chaperonin GroES n=3 Tax=Katanobacteria TaxID=422282 RepID=A0A0G1PG90_UNCKA|nr:MAG: 10 kDa chaperonin [candidate division WWE3 bacterium GW2011_GWA1_46_21]KKU50835.1 MAG: 10 kDa chaperonin [candidate division WWE3 bacterium GW2011_GWC1_47_10]KKU57670.1 MAG: 10 kDa chaperonin [candidate division WWE3 bacterium GW2011_GWB1_47_11]